MFHASVLHAPHLVMQCPPALVGPPRRTHLSVCVPFFATSSSCQPCPNMESRPVYDIIFMTSVYTPYMHFFSIYIFGRSTGPNELPLGTAHPRALSPIRLPSLRLGDAHTWAKRLDWSAMNSRISIQSSYGHIGWTDMRTGYDLVIYIQHFRQLVLLRNMRCRILYFAI